jgi:hypothetical protein
MPNRVGSWRLDVCLFAAKIIKIARYFQFPSRTVAAEQRSRLQAIAEIAVDSDGQKDQVGDARERTTSVIVVALRQ